MLITRETMEDLSKFVIGNGAIVNETIEELPENANQDVKDTLEALQHSLYAAGILVSLYQKFPRLTLMLIDRALK